MPKSPISLFRPFIDQFPRLAAVYRNVRDQLDYADGLHPTPWGFRLAGNAAMAQGTFEPTETAFIRDILKNVDVLVNVGANVGYYCCHALAMGKQVIAFEPIQRNLRYLCKNIKANGWSGVEIFPVALSNSIDVLEMYGGNTGASIVRGWAGIPDSYMTLVPCLTMDSVLSTRLQGKKALILIDVEGAERWVLEGASLMLKNNPKPTWIVEVIATELQPEGVKANPNFQDTFQLFFDNQYHAFTLDRDLCAVSKSDVESFASGAHPLTTNNFVFSESKPLY